MVGCLIDTIRDHYPIARFIKEKKRKPLPQELVTIEGVVGVLCVPDGKIFEDVRKVTMRKQTGQSHQ